MDIPGTLHSKRVALDRARAEVRSLEEQVKYWENAEAMSKRVSVFERIAQQEQAQVPVSEAEVKTTVREASQKAPVDLFAAPRVRNKKGSVRSTILSALNTKTDTSLDEIDTALRAQVNSPVTRASLRTQMMNLKNDGFVSSAAPGLFRLTQKGEASADSRSDEASSASEEL